MYQVKRKYMSSTDEAFAHALQCEINDNVTLTDEEIARTLQNEIKDELSQTDQALAQTLQNDNAHDVLFTDNLLAQALQNESIHDCASTHEGFTQFVKFVNTEKHPDDMPREYGAVNVQEKRDAALARYIHDRDYAYKLQVETDADIARELANENTDSPTSQLGTEGAAGSTDRGTVYGADLAVGMDAVDVGDGYEELLELADQLGDVREKGLSPEKIHRLPSVRVGQEHIKKHGVSPGDSDERHTCKICLRDFAGGDRLRTLPCMHMYHAVCIDQWLAGAETCPVCRVEICIPGK